MAPDMSSSTSSLDDGGFVMVDDDIRSDTSFDDGRTVSIASTEDRVESDDGIATPDDTGSLVDVEEEREDIAQDDTIRGSLETLPASKYTPAVADGRGEEADSLMDSCFDQDLETPRQSTVHTTSTPVRSTEQSSSTEDYASEDPFDGMHVTRNVLIANLPSEFDVSSLAKMCRKFGTVTRAQISEGSDSPRSRRLGYVQMADRAEGFQTFNGITDKVLHSWKFNRPIVLDFVGDEVWTATEPAQPKTEPAQPTTWKTIHPAVRKTACRVYKNASLAMFIAMLIYFLMPVTSPPMVDEVAIRKDALSTAVANLTDFHDTYPNLKFNFTHLFPPTQPKDRRGPYKDLAYGPESLSFFPNLILVSLPKEDKKNGRYIHLLNTRVVKGEQDLAFNTTQLVDGIWAYLIDPDEAFGKITVKVNAEHPAKVWTLRGRKSQYVGISITNDFGKSSLQQDITSLSKLVTRDIAVARSRVKGFGELIALEVSASAAATRNVTTELAVYVARDLQVFANTAVSVLNQVVQANQNASARVYDVVIRNSQVSLRAVENALSTFKKDAKSSLARQRHLNAARRTRAKHLLRDGLIYSRKKALGLKARLAGQHHDDKKPSQQTTQQAIEICAFTQPARSSPVLKIWAPRCVARMTSCIDAHGYVKCESVGKEILRQVEMLRAAEDEGGKARWAARLEEMGREMKKGKGGEGEDFMDEWAPLLGRSRDKHSSCSGEIEVFEVQGEG